MNRKDLNADITLTSDEITANLLQIPGASANKQIKKKVRSVTPINHKEVYDNKIKLINLNSYENLDYYKAELNKIREMKEERRKYNILQNQKNFSTDLDSSKEELNALMARLEEAFK